MLIANTMKVIRHKAVKCRAETFEKVYKTTEGTSFKTLFLLMAKT